MHIKLSPILLCFLLLFSCKQKKKENILSDHISAFTSGMIKTDESIAFYLKETVNVEGKDLNKLVSVSPSTKVKTSYNELSNAITVTPTTEWKSGEEYTVSLDLSPIISGGGKATSNVKVHELYLTVENQGLIIDNKNNPSVGLLVQSTNEVETQKLKSIFNVSDDQVSVKTSDNKRFEITIPHKAIRGNSLSYNGKGIGSNANGKIEVSKSISRIFKISSTHYSNINGKFKINFSKLLDPSQDLSGLITVNNNSATTSIDRNVITVDLNKSRSSSGTIKVHKGIRSKDGKTLNNTAKYDVEQNMVEPDIRWISEGNYIPSEGKFKLPFKARGLKKALVKVAAFRGDRAGQFIAWNAINRSSKYELLRYGEFVYEEVIDLEGKNHGDFNEWNEYGLDLTGKFDQNNGDIYKIYLTYLPSHTTLSCMTEELLEFERKDVDSEWFDSDDRIYGYNDDYNYRERNNPCKVSYYIDNSARTRNIHTTNIFPIVKKGNQTLWVAIKELLDNRVASGAEVSLLSLQGKELERGKINSDGILMFNNLTRDAQAIKVVYEGNTSYFSIKEGEENSYTEFDITSGASEANQKFFAYSERDIRRPGDTIFLNVMLNRNDFAYPESQPIVVTLTNPKNVQVAKRRQNIRGNKHLYTFKIPTSLDDPTGYWTADIKIGPNSKQKNIRVEAIKPNVIDIDMQLEGADGMWIKDIAGVIDAKYLAGYPLVGGTINTTANMYPVRNPFSGYKNYRFAPLDVKNLTDVKLFKGKTNNAGKLKVKSDFDNSEIEAVYRVMFDHQIDLAGGGNNSISESRLLSPYESYVGIEQKEGNGWRGSFRYGEKPVFNIVHCDEKGKTTTGSKKAKITLYKSKRDWWYDRSHGSEDSNVSSSDYYEDVETQNITFKNGKYKFRHEESYGSGMFVIEVMDMQSGHTSQYKYHAIMNQNYDVDLSPEFVHIELDKRNYKIGDKATFKLPKIKNAKALISIEKGSKVLSAEWKDLNKENHTIRIEDNYYPNCYLNVSIVQDYESDENDRPMRMYGVQRIVVENRNDILQPELIVADKAIPNEPMTITVKESKGKPMQYTLAVVDEGLLNISAFKTPDPLRHFSQQNSLRVDTWDIYEQLIKYKNPKYAGIISIGGDDMLAKLDKTADFNRFEPVVFHLGPFNLPKGGKKTHTITLPNYIGQLRVMAVAVNDKTFGNAEKNVRVASPLMLQSQMPRALNISDEVHLPITLFRDEKSINNVNIAATSDFLKIDNSKKSLRFSNKEQMNDKMTFTVGNKAGKTNLKLSANAGKYKAEESTDIFVNYPHGYSSQKTFGKIMPNETKTIDIKGFGYDDAKMVAVNISGKLLPNFTEIYEELIGYPYGCLEQTASQGFALLYTSKLFEMSAEQQKKATEHTDAAVRKINNLQTSSGRYQYWSSGYYHEWSDLFAGLYMLEANNAGKVTDSNGYTQWLTQTNKTASRWSPDDTKYYSEEMQETIQAFRLYILAKASKPNKSSMNRLRNRQPQGGLAKTLLGAAYYHVGMKDIGNTLMTEGMNSTEDSEFRYSIMGSNIRNQALKCVLLAEMNRTDDANMLYENMVRKVNDERWLSTQEKAFVLMASRYVLGDEKVGQPVEFKIKSKKHNVDMKIKPQSTRQYFWNYNEISDRAKVTNTGTAPIFFAQTDRGISDELYPESNSNGISLNVTYTDLKDNPVNLNNLKQGDEIKVRVFVKNNQIIDLNSLALSVKMPSGWELINPRLNPSLALKSDDSNYQDYRDDRVHTFFRLDKGKQKLFQFRAKANINGNFYLPAVQCQDMYQGNINAQSKARRTVIK